MLARIRLLIGNQALASIGFQEPFSLTGNQSYLLSIHPSDCALEKKPFRALNWSASPRTKNVGIASIGASHLDLPIGSSASRMVSLTMKKVKNARRAPISGLATHDITTFWMTPQSIREVSC